MMTSAGAERTRKTTMTIVLPLDVSAIEKRLLLFPVDARGNVPESVGVGIDKAMTRCDIAGRPDAYQTERCTTRVRLVDALVQFGDGVGHVGETVHLAA